MDHAAMRTPLPPPDVPTPRTPDALSAVPDPLPEPLAAQLRRQSDLAQTILDTLSDPHVLLSAVRDDQGAIVDFVTVAVNESAAREFSAKSDALVGLRLGELFPTHMAERFGAALGTVVETGQPYAVDEMPHRSPRSGRSYWLDVRATRLGDGVTATWRDVSDRHRAAGAVIASERRFRLLAENSSDVVMHSRDGQILWVSPAVRSALGWAPQDWEGCDYERFTHPDDAHEVQRVVEELRRGKSVVARVRSRGRDGAFHWCETHTRPYIDEQGRVDGSVTMFRVVDDAVTAERVLRESEARYRLLVEHSSDVVYQTDASGAIVWITPSVTQALGWAPGEVVGRTGVDLVHPDDLPSLRERRDDLLGGTDGTPQSARYRTADGRHRWMSARTTPLRQVDGELVGAVVSLRDITAEREAQDELTFRAFHDPLTGLHNRAWVLDMLDADLRTSRRRGTHVGVLFVDLDNFKVVNDSLGHVAGDAVLTRVAERISAALRPEDRVGRFGGDEFVVVVPSVEDAHDLEAVAHRLIETIAREFTLDQHRIVPTASIGIAVSTAWSTSESLLRDADSALFRAKDSGRARWHFFDEEMHARAVVRLTIEGELRRAVERHEFVVHYQPIVSLADRVVVGHEALVRWQHPLRGLVPPMEFLPVAEESGLIVEMGHQVLEQVCEMLRSHADLPGPISVNVSPLQLSRPGWFLAFLSRIRNYGIDPSRLIIEITETAVLSVIEAVREELESVRRLGTGIHVDDFGTGYSSISLLRDLPVTGIKLDRSFTAQLTAGPPAAAILASGIAGLADGLDLMSIAEGVETENEADILRSLGWVYGQGYLFGRPQSQPALAALPTAESANA